MKRALALVVVLSACAGASAHTEPMEARASPDEAPPPRGLSFVREPLSLRSVSAVDTARESQPPAFVEMLDAQGTLTGTRCGASSFSEDGVLRREDVMVARLAPRDDHAVILGTNGAETGLELRAREITAAGGESRFHIEGNLIVPSDTEAPRVEILPAGASVEMALALFATLLVCNDLGP